MRPPLWMLTTFISVAGCTPRVAPPTPGGAPSPAARSDADTSPYRTPQCQKHLRRYRSTLNAADGMCRRDWDCKRYGGVDPDDVCGGVTDVSTAKALAQIRQDMDEDQCQALSYSCPALPPKCVVGACTPNE